jgi:SAM-dependent methyltransferase
MRDAAERDPVISDVRRRCPDVLGFVLDALPPPRARVLEVGAGDGTLAAALRAEGYDVVAIDPAGGAAGVEPVALHELAAPDESFDAAVAVLSLHHVEPLGPSCERLAQVLRPGARLVVDELDVERLDERAAAWWLEQRGPHPDGPHPHMPGQPLAAGAPGAGGPAAIVAEMREHLHAVARLRAALEPAFALDGLTRLPYLHRWGLPATARHTEEALIAAGALPVTGARFTGTRR